MVLKDQVDAPTMLQGTSALTWARRQVGGALGALGGLGGMVLGSYLDLPLRPIVVLASLGVVLVMVIYLGNAQIRSSQTIRRELAAGYTTLMSSKYRYFWQLDAKTGMPIRPPQAREDQKARDR
jgi:hypothetical protein